MIYLTEYNSVDREQDRRTEHRLGRELLQFALERDYGGSYEVVQEGNAKPILMGKQGIDFSITHTKGLVVCGISDRTIGVDAEYIRQFDERLMRRICTEEEMEYITGEDKNQETRDEKFFRLWTLKESFLKATGQGLSFPMRKISFSVGALEKQMADIRGNIPGWSYTQFWYGDRFIVTICEERKGGMIMTYEEIVDKVKDLFSDADVSMIDEHLAYQFNIKGEGEGIFYAEVKDGKLDIQPYEYYDRDALFICKADVLFKIISGKLDPVLAFTLGKLKVEGSIEKALKLKEFVKK